MVAGLEDVSGSRAEAHLERGLELGVGLDGADLLEQTVHLPLVVVDLAPQTLLVLGRRAFLSPPGRRRHTLLGARARAPLAARHVFAHIAIAVSDAASEAALGLVGRRRSRALLGSAFTRSHPKRLRAVHTDKTRFPFIERSSSTGTANSQIQRRSSMKNGRNQNRTELNYEGQFIPQR